MNTYGRVEHPVFADLPVEKKWERAGYTAVAPREPVGTCVHATWGYGTPEFYQSFFGPTGERHNDALVDYYIDRDGRIARFNDPRGRRSPWANGGSDGLEGDGVDFVRTFGVNAINDRLVSIETEGKNEGLADGQLEALAHLVAYWHDQAGVDWEKFPKHQKYGVVTQLQHYEFATKDCPFAGVRSQTNAYQNRTRAIMQAAQTGSGGPVSVPPPVPVEVERPTLDIPLLTELFGKLVRTLPDGSSKTYVFDPKGAISLAWLNRAQEEHVYPTALRWYSALGEGGARPEIITFSNGWLLWRASERSGFQWV